MDVLYCHDENVLMEKVSFGVEYDVNLFFCSWQVS